MRYDEATKQRARDLRRQGLSARQIAEVLGGAPVSTVRSWIADLPVPEWTRRPTARDAERAAARRMRLAGATYPEIARDLGVSKSSVSLWTRDLPGPPREDAGSPARVEGFRRYVEARRLQAEADRTAEMTRWRESVGSLTDREVLLLGAAAYWAEGTKSKPWRTAEHVTFVNSDPDLIRLFLRFLEVLDVGRNDLRPSVYLHESADQPAAERYWADLIGLPPEQFRRTVLKRDTGSTARKNRGAEYHGCLRVDVLRSRDLYRRIAAIWSAITAA
jgi:transposase